MFSKYIQFTNEKKIAYDDLSKKFFKNFNLYGSTFTETMIKVSLHEMDDFINQIKKNMIIKISTAHPAKISTKVFRENEIDEENKKKKIFFVVNTIGHTPESNNFFTNLDSYISHKQLGNNEHSYRYSQLEHKVIDIFHENNLQRINHPFKFGVHIKMGNRKIRCTCGTYGHSQDICTEHMRDLVNKHGPYLHNHGQILKSKKICFHYFRPKKVTPFIFVKQNEKIINVILKSDPNYTHPTQISKQNTQPEINNNKELKIEEENLNIENNSETLNNSEKDYDIQNLPSFNHICSVNKDTSPQTLVFKIKQTEDNIDTPSLNESEHLLMKNEDIHNEIKTLKLFLKKNNFKEWDKPKETLLYKKYKIKFQNPSICELVTLNHIAFLIKQHSPIQFLNKELENIESLKLSDSATLFDKRNLLNEEGRLKHEIEKHKTSCIISSSSPNKISQSQSLNTKTTSKNNAKNWTIVNKTKDNRKNSGKKGVKKKDN